MTKIVVTGVGGRMGQRLASLSIAAEDLELVGGTEHPGHHFVGLDVGEVVGSRRVGLSVVDSLSDGLSDGQVVLAFTTPAATLADAAICAESGRAMVVGTTGFTDQQLAEFKDLVRPISCVFAPNFSTAMNVLFRLVEEASSILGDDYDVEVIEAHHRLKVDAPSGTALRLAEAAAVGLQRDLREVAVHGRKGAVGARTQKEIGMHAIRAGDLAGDHTVLFGSSGEYMELRHHATSRDSFALGALRAARFLTSVEPGLYNMGHVLSMVK